MRWYIAGPMTGIKDLNFPLFNRAAAELRARGFEVANPAEINGGAAEQVAVAAMTKEEQEEHWRACMRNDIPELLKCQGIALLPGFEKSRGARLELHIAQQLGMKEMFMFAFDQVAA